MALETEVKIPVSTEDLGRIRAQLRNLKARPTAPRQKEENLLFDSPDQRLRAAGCALRLRHYGDKVTLTFKGQAQEDPLYKKREELQTQVQDFDSLRQILEALGFRVSFEYRKFREKYELALGGRCVKLAIDETPVGAFLEIEAEPELIEQAAAQLGWSPDVFVKKTYVEMLLEKLTTDS